jgi:hypothetical protein
LLTGSCILGPVSTTRTSKGQLFATRDEVMASKDRKVLGRYVFSPDTNRLAFDLFCLVDGIGFAESQNTGMLYYVVVTGRVAKSGVVRARAIPAEDTGDLAGTLLFDPNNGSVGGTVNADLFFYGPQS